MEDVPFDLRPFRHIVYEQTPEGLEQLQTKLISAVREITRAVYRFSIRNGQQYKFPHKLLGPDNCFHDFEIPEIWLGPHAAKFYLKEYRYILNHPVETVRESGYGINTEGVVKMAKAPWKLILEDANDEIAHFRLVPK